MLQVFLLHSPEIDFESEDAFPMSERLLPQMEACFKSSSSGDTTSFIISAPQASDFLSHFYSQYELSQPQRRIWKRLERVLSEISTDKDIEFVAMEISSHRSRRYAKKNESFY